MRGTPAEASCLGQQCTCLGTTNSPPRVGLNVSASACYEAPDPGNLVVATREI